MSLDARDWEPTATVRPNEVHEAVFNDAEVVRAVIDGDGKATVQFGYAGGVTSRNDFVFEMSYASLLDAVDFLTQHVEGGQR